MFNTYYYIIYSVFTIFFTCNGMIPSIHTKSVDMPSLQIIKFTLLKNLIKYLYTHIVTSVIYAKTYQTHNISVPQILWEKSDDHLISCFVIRCSMAVSSVTTQCASSIHLPHLTDSDQILLL